MSRQQREMVELELRRAELERREAAYFRKQSRKLHEFIDRMLGPERSALRKLLDEEKASGSGNDSGTRHDSGRRTEGQGVGQVVFPKQKLG